jgi:hypothetical protein
MGAKLDNIKTLDDWVNLTEAAEILGITRQHAYKRAKRTSQGLTGGFKTLRQIGTKPSYVVSRKELQGELDARTEDAEEPVSA